MSTKEKLRSIIDLIDKDRSSAAMDTFIDVMREKAEKELDRVRQELAKDVFEGSHDDDDEYPKEVYEECDCEEGSEDCNCEEGLDEAGRKIVIKVNSKGQRKKKLVCGPGKKSKDGKCVVQKSKEKIARKKGLKKAVRSKKAGGAGALRKANKKRQKALKKRKSQGL